MDTTLPVLLFFDPHREAERRQSQLAQVQPKEEREKRLFCAACKQPVTHQDERIAVAGGHEHRCANPHGLSFRIGCFRDAAGCAAVGAATIEYTWFQGYAWRIAVCAHCRAHLGWRFEADAERFHGLIVDRLTSIGPARGS